MRYEPEIVEVADGVWAYIQPDGGWMVNNMGLVESDEGNLSIDVTSTEARTRRYLESMTDVTGRDISRLVLTHSHPDHCHGASLLPDAEVIAHRNTAEDLKRVGGGAPDVFEPFEVGDIHPRVPTVQIEEDLVLDVGGREVVLAHPGVTAHTRGDVYAWLPESGVLFAGDLVFNGGTPFVLTGSPQGWLQALDRLAALQPAIVVPGHGPVGDAALLEPVADYLRFVMDAARTAVEEKMDALTAARKLDLGRFSTLIDPERIAGNLHRAIADLTSTTPDFAAAFQDMRAYNGGRPLPVSA